MPSCARVLGGIPTRRSRSVLQACLAELEEIAKIPFGNPSPMDQQRFEQAWVIGGRSLRLQHIAGNNPRYKVLGIKHAGDKVESVTETRIACLRESLAKKYAKVKANLTGVTQFIVPVKANKITIVQYNPQGDSCSFSFIDRFDSPELAIDILKQKANPKDVFLDIGEL